MKYLFKNEVDNFQYDSNIYKMYYYLYQYYILQYYNSINNYIKIKIIKILLYKYIIQKKKRLKNPRSV